MNILLVSYYNPLGEGGFEKQTIGLFKCLQQQGHQLACLTVSIPEKVNEVQAKLDLSKIFALGNWVISYQEKSHSVRAKIAFWTEKDTANFLLNQNRSLVILIEQTVAQINDKSKIDVIHIHGLKTAYLFSNKIKNPLLIDLLDSFTMHKKRKILYSLFHEPNKIIFNLIDFFKTLKIEKNTIFIYSQKTPIVTISKSDSQVLQKLCSTANVNVVFPGIVYKQADRILNKNFQKKEKIITFYGFMNLIQNLHPLRYLIYKVIPLVHQDHPDLKLAITGFGLSDEILSLSNKFPWITIFPSVDDITEFLEKATLTCWPFRYGSGVKTKILESMALGKAVVTTTIGVEAFTESQKKGILIADNAKGLANHVTYLLSNPEECNQLGDINRQVAMSEFTWENRAKQYMELYEYAIHKMPKEFCLSK